MKNYQVKNKAGWTGEVTAIDGEFITIRNGKKETEYMFPDAFLADEFGTAFVSLDPELDARIEAAVERKAALEQRKKEEAEALELKKRQQEEARLLAKEKREEERRLREEEREQIYASRYSLTPLSVVKHPVAKAEKHEEVTLTAEQQKALEVLESGCNVFLSGEAGTGKSFLIKEFLYRNRDKNLMVCAPTGVAAINVGGTTLHRAFHIPTRVLEPKECRPNPGEAVEKADIIVIDEISMVRMDVFDYVMNTLLELEKDAAGKADGKFRKKQIIVVGDFYQLPPVIVPRDNVAIELTWGLENFGDGYAFRSGLWKKLNFQPVLLKEVQRQEDGSEFTKNLNRIRKGDAGGIRWFNENIGTEPKEDAICLFARNDDTDAYNRKKTRELGGESWICEADVDGDVTEKDMVVAKTLELKLGMQVMTLVNNSSEGYQNGSIGTIVSVNGNNVEVRLQNGRLVTVTPYTWEVYGYEVVEKKLVKVVLGSVTQIPLRVAYAITIHKSQGQTYERANISPDCFSSGQLYVALSRVKSAEGMSLSQRITPFDLKTSAAVQAFYAEQELRA